MPHDPELAERLRAALRARAGITERRMFGGICWLLEGHMLCGVERGRYMFRVGIAAETQALARPGVSPMDFTGRPMRGFVWVEAAAASGPSLQHWIELASKYIGTLPRRSGQGAGAGASIDTGARAAGPASRRAGKGAGRGPG